MDDTADLVTSVDAQGRFTFVNARATDVFGLPPAACLGRVALDFVHPEDRARTQAWFTALCAAGERRGAIENRQVSVTGAVRSLAWTSTVHTDAAGTVVGVDGVATDVTTARQLEAERLTRSMLESTGLLAGGIAHDFNNLLMIILGSLELLEATPPAEHPALLAEAKAAVGEAHALTQQFLAFAKGGSGLRRDTVVAVAPLVREAVAVALRGSAVTADLRIPEEVWAVESGDPGQLGQVLRNLLLNAKEALPDGGQITLAAANAPDPPRVRLTLTDPGPGIPPDVLGKVFTPYFSTKQRGAQRGMGLGLTVARSIVEQHGGTLALASTPGAGTTVTLTLPAARPAPPPAARPAPPPAARPARARLLVMDDEPGIRTLLARALGPLGYTVDVAAHGAEAVQLAAAALAAGTPYTLALLDLTVKGGPGGVAALQALRQLDPQLRAIAESGSPGHPAIQDPAAHGFQGALRKPFTSAELAAVLEACGG